MVRIGNWSRAIIILFSLFFVVSVIACGGDSSSSKDSPKNDDNSPTANNLNGIWTGTIGKAEDVDATLALYEGEIKGVDSEKKFYAGTYTSTDGHFSATIYYNSEDKMVISGSASDQNKIDATYESTTGVTGDLTLIFNKDLYYRDSSTELLSGEWSSDTSNYSIDTAGSITGTFSNTCQFSGTFAIIDKKRNLYVLEADLTQCEYQGQYSGLAVLDDGDAQNDLLIAVLSTTNDQSIIRIIRMIEHRQ